MLLAIPKVNPPPLPLVNISLKFTVDHVVKFESILI